MSNTAKGYNFVVESGEKKREGVFENSIEVDGGARVWSGCDRTERLTFSSRVRMQSGDESAEGYIDYDREAMSGMWLQLGVEWRQCVG